jgi:hypothetical protein
MEMLVCQIVYSIVLHSNEFGTVSERKERVSAGKLQSGETPAPAKKKAKSKTPHVRPTCGAPKFVSGFIVRANRLSHYGAVLSKVGNKILRELILEHTADDALCQREPFVQVLHVKQLVHRLC